MMEVIPINTNGNVNSKSVLWADQIHSFQESGLSRREWCQQNEIPRDTSVLYYDCTNFYFVCEQPDEDVIDEGTGEVISGMRKYGMSKEHRPNPIVKMGLFMDSRGIPITMCLYPGNTSE